MKLIKNNFWLGGIPTPPVLLDCPSALLSNKDALLLKRENNLIQFFQFGYETLDYESKLLQIKTSYFPWVQFSEKTYVNNATLWIFDIFYLLSLTN